MFLGIDTNTGIIYETGSSFWNGRPLLPTPYIFPLQIAKTPEEALNKLIQRSDITQRLLFREDAYDPVSKVRRGRLYKPETSQPQKWIVLPIKPSQEGNEEKQLNSYQANKLTSWNPSQQLFAAIGMDKAYSMWRIVSIDRMYSNEDLVTMRPLYFLGNLPDLLPDKIPEKWRTKVIENVQKVVDAMYKADADSIVELCRHAASSALFAEFDEDISQANKKDLGELCKMAEQKKRRIIAHSGYTIADLHSRLKPNNQMHYGFRVVSDRDAELAIQCLSFILRDLVSYK
ncbi:MAG: hypothetical protein JXM79_01695 [Sedimentisphaerales bacterium]|nr:hypothetical protein [Sedimentisphaerales bacterium]